MNQKLFGILYVSGILVAGLIANELYKHSKFGKRQQAESEKYHQEAEEGLNKIMNDFMKEKPTLNEILEDFKAKGTLEKWTPETLRNPFYPTEK